MRGSWAQTHFTNETPEAERAEVSAQEYLQRGSAFSKPHWFSSHLYWGVFLQCFIMKMSDIQQRLRVFCEHPNPPPPPVRRLCFPALG